MEMASYFDEVDDKIPDGDDIGLHAGALWHYLNENGLTSIIKLKSEMACTATLLHLALGWLSREGKIEFSREKGQLLVKLK